MRPGGTPNTVSIGRPLFGNRVKTTLIYAEPQLGSVLNPGASGLAANYLFSANGMYDPNITGTGHQPMGFDQLMLMYDHYTVIASKITVTFNNGDATNHQYCGIVLRDTTTPETNAQILMEAGRGRHALMLPDGSDGAQTTLTMKFSAKRFMGRPHPLSEDSLRGSVGANPSEQAYYHCWAAPNTAADGGTVGIGVRIEYIAVFTEPKALTQS